MMSIEEALAQAEIISDDENWVRIEKYPYKSFYEDEEETFIDVEKREISDPSKNVSTLGENNSQLITFVMDRYADGVDLVDMLIQIQYKLQSGEEATAGPVNVYASEDKIKFGWAISNIQTQVVQTIQFIVYCTGRLADGESYLLKTKPMSYRIENTLGIGGYIEKPSDEWFLQFEETMNQKMNQVATLTDSAIDSAAGAKESEQNAAQSASTASTLAGQVQSNTAQAKASADAAKVSEQNAKASEDAARVYAGNASAVANVQIGTSDTAGLLRGGDIYVDESGALKMITTTTETTMPNSYDGRLLVEEIGGVCEQNTTSGKNLLPNTASSTTANGVTFTVNTDGTILVNGTATADTPFVISYAPLKAGNYILSGCPTGGAWNTYSMQYNFGKQETGEGLSITLENDGSPNVRILVSNGATVTNALFKPMIRLASVADATYEPYTGGIPAPNPSYPQEIKKTVMSEIRTHGKNLYNFGDSHVSFNTGSVNYRELRRSVNPFSKGGGNYYFSCSCDIQCSIKLWAYNRNGGSLILNQQQGKITLTDEQAKNVHLVSVVLTGLEANKDYVCNVYPMITAGDIPTDYEPYTESVITLSQPIDLYGKGDVQDVIEGNMVVRKFKKDVYDSNKNWKASSSLEGRYYLEDIPCKDWGIIMCSCATGVHFSSKTVNNCWINLSTSLKGRFLINTEFATVEEWKAYLAEHPMTVVYEMAEEVTEGLPLADHIALNSLSTYDGITYLEFDSEIEPTFKGEYGTSKVGGYTLEALLTARNNEMRITAMETAGEEV